MSADTVDSTTIVELSYQASGTANGAPAVVLLGSLGSDRSMWAPQVAALAGDHEVVTVDLRGHGESPAPPGDYTVAGLAADVLALLDGLGHDAVHLVGLSLGGAVAQHVAAYTPSRVRTLTLLCTAAKFGSPQSWLDRAATVRAEGTTAIADAVVDRWFTAGLAERDPGLIAHSRAMVTATPDDGYAACCTALAHWDGRPDLARITAPTLVIAGAQDPATTPGDMRSLADGIANSVLHVLDPAAHLASVEQAGPVSSLITAHLAGKGERTAAFEQGMRVRRAVLGDAHVDRAVAGTTAFTEPFQDFITRTAWGDIWSRPGLDRHARRLLTLAVLTAVGNTHELDIHIRAALRAGVDPDELAEVFLHTAVYAGVPNSNLAFGLGKAAIAEGVGSRPADDTAAGPTDEEPQRP
ncbi:bifunctional 3-oxoadipate enol-lactonase/4-carboxymuconolactone decarboxylase PcaDC [Nocardia sp. NBC_01329]|uniref:bifunctional 3-oxoadipate enol-lactonase/4-carboxymuconolactone decarboxylase PcaDC n=1 Tax=Nocardia sp. NBC_01329 TaxID=2903594 RepID=UPI002E11AEAD|nr:3-oxoadipate enol-lactonase [Nocardia sp. NBC_01329]